MTGLPDTAGMREALAEALRDELVRLDEWPTGLELADVVLPVVQRLAAKQAVEITSEMVHVAWAEFERAGPRPMRRAIAAALAAAPQPTEEERGSRTPGVSQ